MGYVQHKIIEKTEKEWIESIGQERKLEIYRSLKNEWGSEEYLFKNIDRGRRLKIKFRSGTSGLMEEIGRREGIAKEERICASCDTKEIENVCHALIQCDAYAEYRNEWKEKVLDQIKYLSLEDDRFTLELMLGKRFPTLAQTEIESIDQLSVAYFETLWNERNRRKFNLHIGCEESKTPCCDATT